MTQSILQTKLFVPAKRPTVVPREQLVRQVLDGLHGKLTLISAPAGFGKTTLASDVLAQSGYRHTWLSLDKLDRDPTRFLTYIIAALQTMSPSIGVDVMVRLHGAQALAPDVVISTLINDLIAQVTAPFILVLDDYHVLDSIVIDDTVAFLLDHQPPNMHLMITTREDPSFSLARLRARGELTEVRIADLRFSVDDATAFLNDSMNLSLSANDVAVLDARTEGWIAGLQMAAISMHGRDDIPTFIETFTGSHRFILDYLVEEVLHRQPDHIREFLFQTSILERMNASLCASITGRDDTQAILETLERSNMLIFPLDDQREWYRYHHLFADVLYAHAVQGMPNDVPIWQGRASHWYEQNDYKSDAIRYAFLAEDFERAADLLEMGWPAIYNGFKPTAWREWVDELPDEMVKIRPVLSAGYAWTLLDDGIVDDVETYLQQAERWLDNPNEAVIVNHAEFAHLPTEVAGGRAYLAQVIGDADGAIKHAQIALNRLADDAHYKRGINGMFLSIGYWANGDLNDAYTAMSEVVNHLKRENNLHFQVVGTAFLADIRKDQGYLRDALSLYEQALAIASAKSSEKTTKDDATRFIPGTINLYVGLGDLYRQRGDLDTALRFVETGFSLSQQTVMLTRQYRLFVIRARIAMAQGDFESALASLDRAEQTYRQNIMYDALSILALRARVWLLQGRLHDAMRWADEANLSPDADIRYHQTFDYMTLARVWIAHYRIEKHDDTLQDAITLLERLLSLAESGNRTSDEIECCVLLSLAYHAQDDSTTALEILAHAISLAEPNGFVQVFADEGNPMRHLLSLGLSQGLRPTAYLTALLQAVDRLAGDETISDDPNQRLIEPLSNRELNVLQLVADGYTNQAIADELVIALSTVKKHVNNIYGKLAVPNRTQAINRARELDLI